MFFTDLLCRKEKVHKLSGVAQQWWLLIYTTTSFEILLSASLWVEAHHAQASQVSAAIAGHTIFRVEEGFSRISNLGSSHCPHGKILFWQTSISNTKHFTEQFPLSSTKLLIWLCETLKHGKTNIPIGDKALKYKWRDFSVAVNAWFLTQLMWRTEYTGICL